MPLVPFGPNRRALPSAAAGTMCPMSAADFAEREAALRRILDAPEPTTWRPDDPAEGHPNLLIGELVTVDTGTTAWGERQIAVLRDGEGALWNVWLLHKVLIDEFCSKQPKIGEMLAISYGGRVEPEHGSPYEKYRLVIDRRQGEVQWRDALGGVQPAQPAQPVQRPTPPTPPPSPGPPPVAPPAGQEQIEACDMCGWFGGKHADGCPREIPF